LTHVFITYSTYHDYDIGNKNYRPVSVQLIMLWIVQIVELYDFNSVACCMLTPALVGGGNAEFYVGGIFFPKRRCQPKELKAAKHPNAKM
jgi:hypothetical protein